MSTDKIRKIAEDIVEKQAGYVDSQLKKLGKPGQFGIQVQFVSQVGKTNYMNLDKEAIRSITRYLKKLDDMIDSNELDYG